MRNEKRRGRTLKREGAREGERLNTNLGLGRYHFFHIHVIV